MIKDIKTKINSLEFEKRPFINGEYVESISKERINKISPADGRDISGLRSCNLDDLDKAVQAANQSFKSRIWCDWDPKDKKEILSRLADLYNNNLFIIGWYKIIRSSKIFILINIKYAIHWFCNDMGTLERKIIFQLIIYIRDKLSMILWNHTVHL